MARTNNLTNFLTDVADAIKTKKGSQVTIPAANFDTEIANLPSQGAYQQKSVTISSNTVTTVAPDTGYDAIDELTITTNIPTPQLQSKTYEFTQNTTITLTPEQGYDGFSSVTLNINVPSSEDLEYTELEYIESTGTQYLYTDISPTHHQVRVKFEFTELKNNGFVFGCNYYHFGYFDGSFFSSNYTGSPDERNFTTPAAQINTLYNVILNQNSSTSINNTVVATNFNDRADLTLKVAIFTRNVRDTYTASRTSKVKMYSLQIIDNSTGNTILNLIPVKRKIDDEICMYDKISKQYFTNQGTGVFLAGPEL